MVAVDELALFKKLTKLATSECFVITWFEMNEIVSDLEYPNITFTSVEDKRVIKYYDVIGAIEFDRNLLQSYDLEFGKKVIELVEKYTTVTKNKNE